MVTGTAERFAYTLEGFIEAKAYLKQYEWLANVRTTKFKVFELIAEANRLYDRIFKA